MNGLLPRIMPHTFAGFFVTVTVKSQRTDSKPFRAFTYFAIGRDISSRFQARRLVLSGTKATLMKSEMGKCLVYFGGGWYRIFFGNLPGEKGRPT